MMEYWQPRTEGLEGEPVELMKKKMILFARNQNVMESSCKGERE
jgi:hypothetical protein